MDHLNSNGVVGDALQSKCKRWREQAKTIDGAMDNNELYKYRINRNNLTDCVNGASHFVVSIKTHV